MKFSPAVSRSGLIVAARDYCGT